MSVVTKNPFALLDAEDSASASPAPAPKPTPAATPAPTRGTQKARGGPASRGGKYYARGGAKTAPKDNQTGEEPVTENQRKFEGGGRVRGRGRGASARGGRRPFDRHSQTGKTDSEKKVHQGWGGDDGKTELKAEDAAANDAAAEAVPEEAAADWAVPTTDAVADWGQAADEATKDKPESRPRKEREVEEEDNTLTLDQYLVKKKELDTNLPKIEATRKANEETGDEIWKDAIALERNEEEEAYFIGKSKSTPKPRTKKEEKVFIEIDGRFDRPERGGRGRGRGDRARGSRGRGGNRNTRTNGGSTPAINVDDEAAFPSLS